MARKYEQPERPERKVYTPPELTEYGNVLRLTQGGTLSVASDHGNNMMRP